MWELFSDWVSIKFYSVSVSNVHVVAMYTKYFVQFSNVIISHMYYEIFFSKNIFFILQFTDS